METTKRIENKHMKQTNMVAVFATRTTETNDRYIYSQSKNSLDEFLTDTTSYRVGGVFCISFKGVAERSG